MSTELPEDGLSELSFSCRNCDFSAPQEFKFCPVCGVKQEETAVFTNPFHSKSLKSLLFYFFLNIILLGIYKFSDITVIGPVQDLVFVSIFFAIIDLTFAFYNGRPSFLFGTKTVELKPVFVMFLLLLVFGIAVDFLADFLNRSLFDTYYYVEGLEESGSFLIIVLTYCVFPAIFEELAFRGFLLNNIRDLTNERTAIIVSSILFGIMHLSIISLIWLIPLGLLFAYLRVRYNTLWYGIFGHFFYNFVVTVIDQL